MREKVGSAVRGGNGVHNLILQMFPERHSGKDREEEGKNVWPWNAVCLVMLQREGVEHLAEILVLYYESCIMKNAKKAAFGPKV
jgi:hypothetical protein